MNPFQKLARRKKQHQPSQASWHEEKKLQAELRQCEAWLSKAQARIAELKEERLRLAALSLQGRAVDPSRLTGVLEDLRDLEGKVPTYQNLRTSLRGKLDVVVHPQPAQVAEQASQRTALAELGSSRLSVDRKVDRMVRDLERTLKARQSLSAKMQAVASRIGLKINDLDEKRFDALQGALPTDVLSESERWAREFCGERPGEEYVVVADCFLRPETLGSNGVFQRGDRVRIRDEEVALLPKGNLCPVEGLTATGRKLLEPLIVRKAEPAPASTRTVQGQRSLTPQQIYDQRKLARAGGIEF